LEKGEKKGRRKRERPTCNSVWKPGQDKDGIQQILAVSAKHSLRRRRGRGGREGGGAVFREAYIVLI